MPWRRNVGQPLVLGSSPHSNDELIDDANSNFDDTRVDGVSWLDGGIPESARRSDFELVGETGLDLDFDADTLQEDIRSWNNRPSASDSRDFFNGEWGSQRSFDSGISEGVGGIGSDTGFDFQPMISSTAMSHLVNKTIAEQAALTGIKFPWEQGIHKDIFGAQEDSFSCLRVPLENFPLRDGAEAVETVRDIVDTTSKSSAGPVYLHAVSNISDQSFEDMKQGKLELAITKWLCIIQMHMLASSTGRLVLNLGKDNYNSEEARKIVAAVIGIRSPTTAIGRGNALLRYLRWAVHMFGDIFKAFREESVWGYFNSLSTEGSAATAATSLLSALRYAKYIMGYNNLDEILCSKRLQGSADIMFVTKEHLRQSRVLTVQQVHQLHHVLTNEAAADYDRAAAGYLLLALYGRCRHSDLQNVIEVVHDYSDDGGFLEFRTSSHKTARNALKRTVLLPIVLPVLGVNGVCFVGAVEEAFNKVGLPLRGRINGPVFRPPRKDGSPCRRGLTSTECTRFLQLFLNEPSYSVNEDPVMTSHGLKATGLSWCSKFGVLPADKSILGRHVSATCESSAVYSRDLSTRSVALFQGIILDIFKGVFDPDANYRNYFPAQQQEPEDNQQLPPAQLSEVSGRPAEEFAGDNACLVKDENTEVVEVEDSECDSDSSDSASEFCASSDEDEFHELPLEPPAKVARAGRVEQAQACFKKHRVSKVVHYVEGGNDSSFDGVSVFACGRRVGVNHIPAESFDLVFVCKLCKVRASRDGALSL